MSYLKELVQNAKKTDGFMGRRANYYEKQAQGLEAENNKSSQQGKEKSGFSDFLLLPLIAVGGYILWYYFWRY